MKKHEDIERRTEELILPVLDELSLELWDIEFVKEGSDYFLRIYIDKAGGVNINDCESVSRAFNDTLDSEAYIEVPYIFEVSSPGLTRPLKKEKDFLKSIGRQVDVKLYAPIDGSSEYHGTLKEYSNGIITVSVPAVADSDIEVEDKKFKKDKISLIRLAYIEEE